MSPSEPETEFSDSSDDSPKKKKKGKKSKVETRVSFGVKLVKLTTASEQARRSEEDNEGGVRQRRE